MNTMKKIFNLSAALLLIVLASSCSTTGEYMPLSKDEAVIGTVQTTFLVQSSFFSMQSVKDAINTEAYIKLLEVAAQKYSGNIDIRDIVWVTGRQPKDDPASTEIFTSGKVIQGR